MIDRATSINQESREEFERVKGRDGDAAGVGWFWCFCRVW
jgi:hypothetical protein